MSNIVDKHIGSLPGVRKMFGQNHLQDVNKKFSIFDEPSVTEDKKIQRLSIANQYDLAMEYANTNGRVSNSYYYQMMNAIDSNDKKRRIEDYRGMAHYPNVENALREICNEFFEKDEKGNTFKFELKGNEYNDQIKTLIEKEFYKFLNVFRFDERGWDFVRDWLVEGELFFENIVSSQKTELGILGVNRIAANRIDPLYYDIDNELIDCYILRAKMYDDYPFQLGKFTNQSQSLSQRMNEVIYLNDKQVTYITNEWEATGKKHRVPILSHARGPYRQLSLIEDATVIYMMVRAPERLVFKIDTGNLPPHKAEQYVKRMMANFWTKKTVGQDGRVENVYDPQGMIENYWLPQSREGSGSSIESIGGGKQSADNLDTLNYFVQKLYTSLHVPLSRLSAESTFGDGEAITREELRFAEFIISIQKKWASAIKKSFIVHLKLRGKKLLHLAKKFKVKNIDVPDNKAPSQLVKRPVKEFFQHNFLSSEGWNILEILEEQIRRNKEEVLLEKDKMKSSLINRLIQISEDIHALNHQLITEKVDQTLKDVIREKAELLLAEREEASKTLEYLDGEIKEIEDEGLSWWEQYEIQEEDIDIKMIEPVQFFQIRQQQLFQQKMDNYTAAASQDFISPTLAQKWLLDWDDEQITINRILMQKDAAFRWELAQIEANGPDFREKALAEASGAMTGDEFGGGGGGMPGMGGPGESLPDFGAPLDSGGEAEAGGNAEGADQAPAASTSNAPSGDAPAPPK